MTANPVLESASKILLDYVEDTKLFATAINESVGGAELLTVSATSFASRPLVNSCL